MSDADRCTAMWSDINGVLYQCVLPGDHSGSHRMHYPTGKGGNYIPWPFL